MFKGRGKANRDPEPVKVRQSGDRGSELVALEDVEQASVIVPVRAVVLRLRYHQVVEPIEVRVADGQALTERPAPFPDAVRRTDPRSPIPISDPRSPIPDPDPNPDPDPDLRSPIPDPDPDP